MSGRLGAWVIALFAICLLAVSGNHSLKAQFNGCLAGFCAPKAPGGATYTGPCDAIGGGCATSYGFLSGTATYSSALSSAATICDAATQTTCTTIKFLSTGYWDAATASASSSCTVACVVTKFFDSSGNAKDAPVLNSAHSALVNFSSLATCTSASFSATVGSDPDYTVAISTGAQPFSMIGIGKRTTNTTTQQDFMGTSAGGGTGFGWEGAANALQLYASSNLNLSGTTDNVWYGMAAVANGASGAVNGNASSTTGNAGTQVPGGTLHFMSDPFGNGINGAFIVFGAYIASAVTPGTVVTNLRTYCGTF